MIRKLLLQAIIVSCVCVLSLALAGWAWAQTAMVKGNVVNLRSGPGTGYTVVGEVKQGDRLSVVGASGEWSKVSRGSDTVWIHGTLITMEAAASALVSGNGQIAVVTGKMVNLRARAGTSHPVVGEASVGTRLPVVGKSGDWLNVLLSSGKTAWVAGWLVRLEGLPAPVTPAPALDPSGSLLPSTQPVGKVGVVTGSIVNLRAGAGTSYPVIGQVSQGARLPVLDGTAEWINVQLASGQAGWISRSLIRIDPGSGSAPVTVPSDNPAPPVNDRPPAPVATPGQSPTGSSPGSTPSSNEQSVPAGLVAVVKVNTVDIRSNPTRSASSIAQATAGFRLTIMAQLGDWYKVKLPSGTLGWLMQDEVSVSHDNTPSRDGEVGQSWTLETSESGDRTQILIKSPVAFEYQTFTLRQPDRLVIDLYGIPDTDLPSGTVLRSQTVSQVRTGWQSDTSAGRVVCDFVQGLGFTRHRVEVAPDRRSLKVELWTVKDILQDRVIVLDPGHGGADPGAIGPTGLREKDFNLPVAMETARLLREEGVEVILTRTTDVRLGQTVAEDLERRSRIANQNQADLFVSIHANANPNRSKEGTSVYYHSHPDNHIECSKLARALQGSLVRELGRKDLGIFDRQFLVLKNLDMPGALVETAFVSNYEEERLLAQDWFRSRTALAIVDGIKAYYAH